MHAGEARRGEAVAAAVPTDVSTVPNHPRDHHHNKNTTAMDLTFALSAIVFTLLALVVATSLLNGSSPAADFMNARGYFGVGSERTAVMQNGHGPDTKKKKKKAAADDWCEMSCSSHDHWDVVKNVQSTEGAAESPGANADKLESNNPLKYVPGKARSHHMEMMMSKEELEEEQRVQREQLAAIFQLLKDNTETFGDVSEGDLEEQMRLYSI